jgi:hypothetical protein
MRIFMPAGEQESIRALSDDQIQLFVRDGFVRIDRAFPRELADEARAILWRDTGCDPHDPATWTKPVIRLFGYKDPPFLKAERTPVLHAAFDQIVGKGRWRLGSPPGFGGTFAVRFPHPDEPGDDGWHIDTSFPPDGGDPNERNDFSAWRANVRSRGRTLLMLFLFSDVGPQDAPTRIRVGSHIDMARHLATAGEAGMSHKDMMLDQMGAGRSEALATGEAGDVYLCHPFLVHAAQRHQGMTPRFMAQPPLHPHPQNPLRLDRENGDYSPVEIAIRQALQGGPNDPTSTEPQTSAGGQKSQ